MTNAVAYQTCRIFYLLIYVLDTSTDMKPFKHSIIHLVEDFTVCFWWQIRLNSTILF